jgi:hypothetical protein
LALEQRWTDCEEHLSPTNLTSAVRIGDPRWSCFRPVPGPEVGSPRDGDYPSYRLGYPFDLSDTVMFDEALVLRNHGKSVQNPAGGHSDSADE